MPTSIPAATLMVLRDSSDGPQVLLVKRHSELVFAPDCWVFPGGKLEPSDYESGTTIEDHARCAAVRETREETSLILQADRLVSTNHWTTPPGYHKSYATWFFVTHMSLEQDAISDGREIVDSVWLKPTIALEQDQTRQMLMLQPTLSSLVEIASFSSCSQILDWYKSREVTYY